MSRLLVCAAVLAFCLAAAPAARADGLLGGDPRGDAKGNSVLDIASARHGHQGQLLKHRLTTYRRWRRALLANGGEISFYFNTDGDAALERRLDVRYARGTLSAVMKDRRGGVVGRGLARKRSRHTVVVKFAPSLLRAGIGRYRWFAFAGFRCRHRYKVCGDRAPNGGRLITHQLGSPLPPPSGVAILTPSADSTVSGTVTFRARAPVGTEWMGFYGCGGRSIGEDAVPNGNYEWSVQWDTTMEGCSNGTQPIDAYAFRNDGSMVGEAHSSVNVDNAAPPPPPPPSPPDCNPSSEPGPIAGQGYTVRFKDCFGVFDTNTWATHQWWESNPPPGSIYVQNGNLHVVRKRAHGFADVTVSSEPHGSNPGVNFQYGYFEARMKWTGAVGSGPAFWLFSTAHATNPNWPNPACPIPNCLSAELDVFEGYGDHPDVFTGTIHRNSCGCYGEPSQMNSNNWQPQAPGTNLAADYHIYAAKWTPTLVSWYLDGNLVMSHVPFDSFNQRMHLLFYQWNTPWEPGNTPNASTPDELHTEVDWVRVWQR